MEPWCRWLPLLVIIFFEILSSKASGKGGPIVYLTVSSLIGSHLELNWERLPDALLQDDNVRVSLHDEDPNAHNARAAILTVRPNTQGYFRTSVQFPEQTFHPNNLTSDCLGYWIQLRRGTTTLADNCLRARPHWMHESIGIGNLSLAELLIPGTHNAGCRASTSGEDKILGRYLYTQQESIWNQLVYGIRYLDLRVAYRETSRSNEKFWITHSSFRTDVPVRDVLRDVRTFLDATQEIVIVDFHRFVTGFQGRTTRRRHTELITMLVRELGDYLVPGHFTSLAPLSRLWTENKRLYVGYADTRSRSFNSFLFPGVRHLWGDVDTIDDLFNYLNETVCTTGRRRLTSAMVQLTPTATGVLFNTYGGLRKMADGVNRHASRWFRDGDLNECANLVATDFFQGTDIVEIAIDTNQRRATRQLEEPS